MKSLMKIILLLIISILMVSCECPEKPDPPYGPYDDYSNYDGSDCYKSISYIYYCHNGRYRNISYTRSECCSEWEKSSYTSNCINFSQQNDLIEMNKNERFDFYNSLND